MSCLLPGLWHPSLCLSPSHVLKITEGQKRATAHCLGKDPKGHRGPLPFLNDRTPTVAGDWPAGKGALLWSDPGHHLPLGSHWAGRAHGPVLACDARGWLRGRLGKDFLLV